MHQSMSRTIRGSRVFWGAEKIYTPANVRGMEEDGRVGVFVACPSFVNLTRCTDVRFKSVKGRKKKDRAWEDDYRIYSFRVALPTTAPEIKVVRDNVTFSTMRPRTPSRSLRGKSEDRPSLCMSRFCKVKNDGEKEDMSRPKRTLVRVEIYWMKTLQGTYMQVCRNSTGLKITLHWLGRRGKSVSICTSSVRRDRAGHPSTARDNSARMTNHARLPKSECSTLICLWPMSQWSWKYGIQKEH